MGKRWQRTLLRNTVGPTQIISHRLAAVGFCHLYSHQNHEALAWLSFTAFPLPTSCSTASEVELITSCPSRCPLTPNPRSHCGQCGQDSFKQSAAWICWVPKVTHWTLPVGIHSVTIPMLCFPVFTKRIGIVPAYRSDEGTMGDSQSDHPHS